MYRFHTEADEEGLTMARVVPFKIKETGAVGVGVYPTSKRGTVLRWDRGLLRRPTVIHWQAPHCADDQCGSPCGHVG